MRATAIVVLVLGTLNIACDRSPHAAGLADANATSKAPTNTSAANTIPGTPVPVGVTQHDDAAASAAAPRMREVTLPAGTQLPLVLDTPVASDTSQVEQAVHAHLARPV